MLCLDTADADDNGGLNLPDAGAIDTVILFEQSVPPLPYPAAEADPTADQLGCGSYPQAGST